MGDWQPFVIPDGSYADPTRPWTDQDVVNFLPIRAEAQGTRSSHLLRTAPGLKLRSYLGSDPVRGMRDVEGALFVVAGNKLYRVFADGTSSELGTVPGTGPVSMTHNQVAGGNQLVIANGSAGYLYDTRDDSLINPTEPEDEPGENPTAPGGGTPSTGLGPNGGYPDDDEPAIPLPTVFGTDLIDGGDFSDPSDLDDWADPSENALVGWTIVSGAAHYNAAGSSKAIYFPARYRMSPQPFPRYSVTVTGDLTCDAGVKVAIGMIVGYSTVDNLPQVLYTSDPAEYLTSTPVSHIFDFKQQDAQQTPRNQWVYPNAAPVMYVYSESGNPVEADFDNITMEVAEVATPVTPQTLTNLDFASGLTGWTVRPEGGVMPRVSGGQLIHDASTDSARIVWIACDDPIDLADEQNKYVHIEAEAWCNDPTTQLGIPQGGVALGIIYRSPGGAYSWPGNLGVFERGDWTAREVWARQQQPTANLTAGWTVHLLVGLCAWKGYVSKVRNIAVEVTDSAVSS